MPVISPSGASNIRTTDSTGFNLDLNAIVEEAFERCGAEVRTGYDLRTARRSLNLLLLDWANRGINLWTVQQEEIPLVYNVDTYDLPVDTVDLLDHVIRTGTSTNQTDITITRISGSTYSAIPNKNATGRPIQVWVNRKSGATNAISIVQYPQFIVWPKPDNSTNYMFVYWRLRRLQEAGNGVNGQDIPFRFLPCLVSGLSYMLSMKIPGAESRVEMLKMSYDEQWQLAAEEDRDKSPVRFVPRQMF
jgi:hypothetical protein